MGKLLSTVFPMGKLLSTVFPMGKLLSTVFPMGKLLATIFPTQGRTSGHSLGNTACHRFSQEENSSPQDSHSGNLYVHTFPPRGKFLGQYFVEKLGSHSVVAHRNTEETGST
jgi:hypothetical protein